METVGLFSAPGSTNVDTEYGLGPNATVLPERWKGRQITRGIPPAHPLHGRSMDLDIRRLGENDPYVDPGKHDRAAAKEAIDKRVSEKGFLPPKGSHGDTFGEPVANMNEGDDVDVAAPAPRGVYTNPGKKGCAGTPGITIGGDFDAMDEEYQPARALSRKAVKAARAKIEKPWGGGAGVGVSRCFDANNSAYAYAPGAWAEPEKPKRKEEDPDAPKPFKPPSTHGRGAPEVFAHVSDPTDYDGERRRAARAASRKAGRFYPPKGAKSTPTSTIGKYDRGTWTAPSSLRETQLIK